VLLSLGDTGESTGKAAEFVSDFFADDWQSREDSARRFKLHQKDVHNTVGASLDQVIVRDMDAKPASVLMSKSYINFSNYVHGRHVESMDLYGGKPGHFHLHGMSGTPKDAENIEAIKTLMPTASNCLLGIVQGFRLYQMIAADQSLLTWYRRGVGADNPNSMP
jgi:hypothetical protein